eukprot:Blabericola_migrator_1__10060@NODE_5587_length_725_cov_5_028875_g3632_i0_p1_GENE_NODE_5587_length_725_cov_5_028875_g3632_i0NODE_5587_length_725_cov_5_028875_g3632_i0_p1_ORF_typecomplete_len212_score28_71LCD1/PF09798_9/0_063_NODE_5587_length_725_cov_5_028875_g3632_i03638
MVQITMPRPEHTEHRIRVQKRVEQEMDEFLFTLKSRIYRDELHAIIKEIGHDGPRTCIAHLASCPVLKMNTAERQTLEKLGDLSTLIARKGRDVEEELDMAKPFDENLTELLNSLANKVSDRACASSITTFPPLQLLFYLLIEYRSWFPQDKARNKIVSEVFRAIFGDGDALPKLKESSPKLVKYIDSFVVQRTKNFRDVISRVLKREKAK